MGDWDELSRSSNGIIESGTAVQWPCTALKTRIHAGLELASLTLPSVSLMGVARGGGQGDMSSPLFERWETEYHLSPHFLNDFY